VNGALTILNVMFYILVKKKIYCCESLSPYCFGEMERIIILSLRQEQTPEIYTPKIGG